MRNWIQLNVSHWAIAFGNIPPSKKNPSLTFEPFVYLSVMIILSNKWRHFCLECFYKIWTWLSQLLYKYIFNQLNIHPFICFQSLSIMWSQVFKLVTANFLIYTVIVGNNFVWLACFVCINICSSIIMKIAICKQ